ncbi:hypothetical protein DD594_26870, partial [Enterobacter cloacae complex sp. 4DZ1-17B1]|uniref:hypothetical protein n=1 Tax=Enterobacter cloacae complex sp. 4DZ1-17B1 TaxID=2511991 RepID=UPI001027CE43
LSRMANGAYDACNGRGGKEGSAFYFDGLRLCLINVGLSKPVYWPDGAVELAGAPRLSTGEA